MHDPSRSQKIKGVPKPSAMRRNSSRIVRNVRFDHITDQTLFDAISILQCSDPVSIGLVVRRAIMFYGERLMRNPDVWEMERALVRKGARIAKSSAAAAEEKKEVQS